MSKGALFTGNKCNLTSGWDVMYSMHESNLNPWSKLCSKPIPQAILSCWGVRSPRSSLMEILPVHWAEAEHLPQLRKHLSVSGKIRKGNGFENQWRPGEKQGRWWDREISGQEAFSRVKIDENTPYQSFLMISIVRTSGKDGFRSNGHLRADLI